MLNGSSPLKRFVLRVVLFIVTWFSLYYAILKPLGQPDKFLRHTEARLSVFIFSSFNYEFEYADSSSQSTSLYHHSNKVIGIANSCNGLILFIVFCGFIVCVPGYIKPKLWFIPIGIVLIFFVNVIRIVSLTYIQIHYPAWLNFNHHYVFTLLVYGFIFGLWMYYIKKVDSSLKQISENW